MKSILIVEDERNIRESLAAALSAEYEADQAASGEEALEKLKKRGYDMLITDIRMPGMSGVELLGRYRKDNPDNPVIVITAFTSVQNAVEAMKAGANEYIPKPFSLEEVEIKVKNLFEAKKAGDDREFYKTEKDTAFGDMVGAGLEGVKRDAEKAGPSDITVLITGDTGTGKELLAYTLHKLSKRRGPFVPVHCAAYAKGVIESELFGHEKGAFTGAEKQRKGKIEYAEGGTLFLDEVGDIPAEIQVKLLRVLENRTFERVGGNISIRTDARVICATNRDLREMIKKGEFREDLYYRINVFPIRIPALRERRQDIIPLAEHFLAKIKPGLKIDAASRALLEGYGWPGNVRELQNIIERAAVLSDNETLRVDLAMGRGSASGSLTALEKGEKGLEEILADMEKDMISTVLSESGNNQTKAASILKISRTTLQYKMNKYGIKGD